MTSEDGDLYPLNQEETSSPRKKKKNCYLPPAEGWFSGEEPPDPVAESWKELGLAGLHSKLQKQKANQRLATASKEPSYPPPGWEFDR